MRDFSELINRLRRSCAILVDGGKCEDCAGSRCMEIDAADAIEELLDELTTIRKQLPHWISVEERLPEDGKDVLCWYEYYHWNKEKMLPEYGIGYCINGHWGGEVSNGRDCKVLYWMPLPAPPKGVE